MIEQLNSLSFSWFEWMFSMFWQVSLLILIISMIDLVIKKWAWPQVRYALWTLVLLKLIIPPTWAFSGGIIPNIRAEIVNDNIPANFSEQPAQSMIKNDNNLQSPVIDQDQENQATLFSESTELKKLTVEANLSWKAYFMGVWLLGILFFGVILGSKISKLKNWHKEQEEKKNIPEWFHNVLIKVGKTLSVERLPSIVFSNEALSPAVYGIFRPVLLLPEKYLDELNEDEAEHVLLHELAHIKRGDLIVHGICLILQIFYWFNPFLIWSRKQMKHIREICCDMTIANILREKTKQYKKTLINTARELLTENTEPAMGLLGLFEEPFQLIARLKWLNKESWKSRQLAYGTAIISALIFTAFILPMGEKSLVVDPVDIYNFSDNANLEDYKAKIVGLTEELNDAFIEWDIETISKFYTENAILDEIQHPTVKGKDKILEYLNEVKESGTKFNELKNFIADFWKEENYLHTIESFHFDISILNPELRLSGSGSSYTIWEIQDDESIKIKYSILNLSNTFPEMIGKGE